MFCPPSVDSSVDPLTQPDNCTGNWYIEPALLVLYCGPVWCIDKDWLTPSRWSNKLQLLVDHRLVRTWVWPLISKKDQHSRTEKMKICLFIILVGSCLVKGQSNYCSISRQHTMCQFQGVGPACGQPKDRGLSAAEKKEVLDYHNRFAPYQTINCW